MGDFVVRVKLSVSHTQPSSRDEAESKVGKVSMSTTTSQSQQIPGKLILCFPLPCSHLDMLMSVESIREVS
jgi:hypothetical protein